MVETGDNLTPAEMREFLDGETRDRKRESEIREKAASDLVTAYEGGAITSAEANRHFYDHLKRWGQAFDGLLGTTEGLSDEEIVKQYDAQRARSRGRSSGYGR